MGSAIHHHSLSLAIFRREIATLLVTPIPLAVRLIVGALSNVIHEDITAQKEIQLYYSVSF